MRVVRGRAESPSADREATRELLDQVAESGEPAARAWTPHRHLAFGRRDANAEEYERARAAARDRGFPPVERSVGGRAVAYTGTTVAFAALEPVEDGRRGIDERYDDAVDTVVEAVEHLGVDARPGEPADSFCPGSHSIQAPLSATDAGVDADETGPPLGKVAGIAQRVVDGAALVAGVVVVTDREAVREVLAPVYDALDVPFEPRSVGSLAAAGGPDDPGAVARVLESAVVGDRETTVETLDAALAAGEDLDGGDPAETVEE